MTLSPIVKCFRCKRQYKPSEIDANRISQAHFKLLKKVPFIKDQPWMKNPKAYLDEHEVEDFFFCEVCY